MNSKEVEVRIGYIGNTKTGPESRGVGDLLFILETSAEVIREGRQVLVLCRRQDTAWWADNEMREGSEA